MNFLLISSSGTCPKNVTQKSTKKNKSRRSFET